MSDDLRKALEDCRFCGSRPKPVSILVHYNTARRNGPHDMVRIACQCGAIGKCRPDAESAAASWNEPWQALASTPDSSLRLISDEMVDRGARGVMAGFGVPDSVITFARRHDLPEWRDALQRSRACLTAALASPKEGGRTDV